MHLDLALIAGSAVVGLLVGLTGMGGGALMTPMLVLLFGVAPSAAISSDLVAALFMKPAGVAIHWRQRTVQHGIVRYLGLGSVPAAFLGTFTMHEMGNSASAERVLQTTLGVALMLGAVAMLGRAALTRQHRESAVAPTTRPLATFLIGLVGGFMVGLTSVGAGSLILVLLLIIYPSIRNDHLIGTDLAQSLPLTLSATAGTLLFGHVAFALTASIIVGSVPAVIVGALISAKRSSARLRPVITGVVLLTGLKYVGVPVGALGVCALVVAAVVAAALLRGARRRVPVARETVGAELA